jgi:hypothetical protein
MARRFVATLSVLMLTALTACAELGIPNPFAANSTAVVPKAPPGGNYRKVSELVRFPNFFPGLGTLYVQPETLPTGPFQAYDREGNLVSTIYMVPISDLEARKMFDELEASPVPVNHVDMYYNSGHPGVEEPHYHIILWHVSSEQAENLT